MYTILIVDDEPVTLKGLRHILDKSPSFEVTEAADGQEAYRVLSRRHHDIAILDIRMPKMTGLELCRRLRRIDRPPEVIILTGYDEFSYVQNALRYGVRDFILKPVTTRKVHEAVDKIVQFIRTKQEYQYLSYKDQESLVNELVEAIWKGEGIHPDAFTAHLEKTLISFPFEYSLNLARDIIVTAGEKLGTRLGARCKVEPALYDDSDGGNFGIWLEGSVGVLEDEFQRIKRSSHFSLIEFAKSFIEKNYTTVTLEEAARRVGFNASYFSHLFKETTGVSFTTYRAEMRINKAKALLHNPEKSVTEITYDVGYSDITHFIRTFKKITGICPTEFRKRQEMRL